MTEPEGWHGWSSENSALFVAPMTDSDNIGVFLQQGRDVQLAGVFVDPAMAQMVMGWLDDTLTATAAANYALLERLQTEQPLVFAAPRPVVHDEDDDDRGEYLGGE